jgi:sugar (pentulose or hexulose) kinase
VSPPPIYIGIDPGRTVCKAPVFNPNLRLLAGASRPLELSTLSGTEFEQDAEGWRQSAVRLLPATSGSGPCWRRRSNG